MAHSVRDFFFFKQKTAYKMVDLGKLLNSHLFENLKLELRRGSLIIAVLTQLREEHYAYALRKALAARGMGIAESTLYPRLRRLGSPCLLARQSREEATRD